MNEQECSFCKSIRMQKTKKPFLQSGTVGEKTIYEAALVATSFIVHEKDKQTVGFVEKGYKLRYCPQCARDLSKDISEEGVLIYDSTRNDEQDS